MIKYQTQKRHSFFFSKYNQKKLIRKSKKAVTLYEYIINITYL